jgi:hypothetical protein
MPNQKTSHQDQLLGEDDKGSAGGGETGKIHFKLDLPPGRDDLLPAHEVRRLLALEQDLHKGLVTKQKISRQDRKALKEGRSTASLAQKQRAGLGAGSGGSASRFKSHPLLSKTAQFSGMSDAKVTANPNLNEAETNPELKDKLENKLQNQYKAQPKFDPRPRPPGG